jgi:hypothetical protein
MHMRLSFSHLDERTWQGMAANWNRPDLISIQQVIFVYLVVFVYLTSLLLFAIHRFKKIKLKINKFFFLQTMEEFHLLTFALQVFF